MSTLCFGKWVPSLVVLLVVLTKATGERPWCGKTSKGVQNERRDLWSHDLSFVKGYPHRRRIGVRPELSGRIAIHFMGAIRLLNSGRMPVPLRCEWAFTLHRNVVPGRVLGGEAGEAESARHIPDVAQGVHPQGEASPGGQHPVPTGVRCPGSRQVVVPGNVKVSSCKLFWPGPFPRILMAELSIGTNRKMGTQDQRAVVCSKNVRQWSNWGKLSTASWMVGMMGTQQNGIQRAKDCLHEMTSTGPVQPKAFAIIHILQWPNFVVGLDSSTGMKLGHSLIGTGTQLPIPVTFLWVSSPLRNRKSRRICLFWGLPLGWRWNFLYCCLTHYLNAPSLVTGFFPGDIL